MATPLPIVCTLDAAALGERVAEMRALGAEGLIDSRFDGDRARLRFRHELAARLEAVVAEERECCAWLGLELARDGGAVELTLTAPPGSAGAMREFAAAFRGGRVAGAPRMKHSAHDPARPRRGRGDLEQ